jgi:hypothetical protein
MKKLFVATMLAVAIMATGVVTMSGVDVVVAEADGGP